MRYLLGIVVDSKDKHSKLKMKTLTSEVLTVGAWGLHLTSFIVASIPYLQAASLVLAIAVSLLTLNKLVRDSRNKRSSDEEID